MTAPQMYASLIEQAVDGDRHVIEAEIMRTDRDTIRAELMITPNGEVTL